MSEAGAVARSVLARVAAPVRRSPLGALAAVVFLIFAIPITLLNQGERSSWIQVGNGSDARTIAVLNPLIGYSGPWGQTIVHKENFPSLEQVIFFAGEPQQLGLYRGRALYGFFASLLQPFFGVWGALLATNFLAYAAFALCAWRLALDLFDDELAGVVAVALAAVGMGMVVGIGDLSAHVLGFAAFAACAVAIHESRVVREARPLATHLRLGLALGVGSLAYPTCTVLTLGYALLAIRKNRWLHILVTLALPFVFVKLWDPAYNAICAALGHAGVPDLYATERGLIATSVDFWKTSSLAVSVPFTIVTLVQFTLIESPPVVLLALASFLSLVRDGASRAFVVVITAAPVIPALVLFCPAGAARGYVVYAISVLCYACVGGLVARGMRSGGRTRVAVVLGLVLLLGFQLAWDHAHLLGRWGPVTSYFNGLSLTSRLQLERPEILSLTGHEPTPIAFGGSSPIVEAGLHVEAPLRRVYPNLWRQLLARSFHLGACAALVLSLPTTRRGRGGALAAFAVVALVPAWLTVRTLEWAPVPTDADRALALPANARGELAVTLSDGFLDAVEARARPGDRLELFARVNDASKKFRAGTEPLEATPLPFPGDYLWTAPLEPTLAALRRSHSLVLEVTSGAMPATAQAWQRRDLPGRAVSGPWQGLPMLPILEVRLRAADGTLRVAGF